MKIYSILQKMLVNEYYICYSSNMRNELHILEEFRMLDDAFMILVFEDNLPAVELVLQILTGEEDLTLENMQIQKEIRNPYGHSVRLDIAAEDVRGRRFNIEVQRDSQKAPPQRLRYYSSMADTRMLRKGADYTDLPDSHTIFLMEEDIKKSGRPLYCFKRQDGAEELNDGSYLLYVNGAYEGDDPIGKLMHDFRCARADEMNYPLLAERVRYLKESEEGRQLMTSVYYEWKDEVERQTAERVEKEMRAAMEREMEEAETRAADKATKEVALKVLKNNKLTEAEVVQYFGLTMEEVRELSERGMA